GAIGDFLVSLPALECLQPDEVWTAGRHVPLVRFASRSRSIASTGLDLLGVTEPPAQLIEKLRSFDSIVSWYGANRPDFRHAVRHLDLPFPFFPALPAEGAGMHATDFYLEHARTLGACESDGIPRIDCGGPPRENFAVIHPFSGGAR